MFFLYMQSNVKWNVTKFILPAFESLYSFFLFMLITCKNFVSLRNFNPTIYANNSKREKKKILKQKIIIDLWIFFLAFNFKIDKHFYSEMFIIKFKF